MPILRSRLSGLVRSAASVLLGCVLLYWASREVKVSDLSRALSNIGPFVPLLVPALLGRIAFNALAAKAVLAKLGHPVPFSDAVRAEMAGNSLGNVLPAGRLAAEATKAAMLSRHASGSAVAVLAALRQALHLLASALVTAAALFACARPQAVLRALLATTMIALAAAGGLLLVAGRSTALMARLARWPSVHRRLAPFATKLATLPAIPPQPFAFMLAARVLEALLFAVLCRAASSTANASAFLVAPGLLVLGATAADFVPGQLGGPEATFSRFAEALGTGVGEAVSIALCWRLLELAVTVVGFAVLSKALIALRGTPSVSAERASAMTEARSC